MVDKFVSRLIERHGADYSRLLLFTDGRLSMGSADRFVDNIAKRQPLHVLCAQVLQLPRTAGSIGAVQDVSNRVLLRSLANDSRGSFHALDQISEEAEIKAVADDLTCVLLCSSLFELTVFSQASRAPISFHRLRMRCR